jgi:hypothetical protein
MAWSDALDERPEPERQTGTDWLIVTTYAEQAKVDRRMSKARRQLDKAERKYLRKMRGHDHD